MLPGRDYSHNIPLLPCSQVELVRTFYKIAGFILLCCLFKYCAKRFQAPVYYNLIYHLANLFPVRKKVENVCKFANLLALSTIRISKLQKIVLKSYLDSAYIYKIKDLK